MEFLRLTTTLLVAITAIGICFGFQFPLPGITGDNFSTIRIVARMCVININDTTAEQFWNCYNETEGIVLFETCQLQVFGFKLNTTENFERVCNSTFQNFPIYAGCLFNEFGQAGIDLSFTLNIVNQCEAEVLGIKANSSLLSLVED